MHLHKFAEEAFFDEIGEYQTRPATKEYRSFFQNLHPSQFLNSIVRIPVYEVKYSYFTKRENYRVAYKYMFLKQEYEEAGFEIEMAFRDWVENMNKEKPYRAIFNAEILEIRPVAYAALRIGL